MGRTILFATLAAGLLAFVGGTAFAAVVQGTLGADELAGDNAPDTPPGLPLESDTISCGPGHDRVVAHTADRVAGDCEQVDCLGSGN